MRSGGEGPRRHACVHPRLHPFPSAAPAYLEDAQVKLLAVQGDDLGAHARAGGAVHGHPTVGRQRAAVGEAEVLVPEEAIYRGLFIGAGEAGGEVGVAVDAHRGAGGRRRGQEHRRDEGGGEERGAEKRHGFGCRRTAGEGAA